MFVSIFLSVATKWACNTISSCYGLNGGRGGDDWMRL